MNSLVYKSELKQLTLIGEETHITAMSRAFAWAVNNGMEIKGNSEKLKKCRSKRIRGRPLYNSSWKFPVSSGEHGKQKKY
jgi:hypothetical protein